MREVAAAQVDAEQHFFAPVFAPVLKGQPVGAV
jgi:hypothetical protein